jgi:hypothetical protein
MKRRHSVTAVTSPPHGQSYNTDNEITQENVMTKIVKTTRTGLARIFKRFGRTDKQQNPWRGNRWYENDMCSRGL